MASPVNAPSSNLRVTLPPSVVSLPPIGGTVPSPPVNPGTVGVEVGAGVGVPIGVWDGVGVASGVKSGPGVAVGVAVGIGVGVG